MLYLLGELGIGKIIFLENIILLLYEKEDIGILVNNL